MKDKQIIGLALLGIPVLFFVTIASIVVVGALTAWVVYQMYTWFVVPLGAPGLNFWHIWGLFLLWGILKYRAGKSNKDGFKETFTQVTGQVVGVLVVLLVGWLIKGNI